MNDTIIKQIQEHYRLEIFLLRLRRQASENKAALRQAKFNLREATVAQAEYGGSFRSFREKLAGKKEETETALRHAVQQAEAGLTSARQTEKRLALQLAEVQGRLEQFPAWEALKDQTDPEAWKQWHRLEALYCIEALTPLLEENCIALTERRKMTTGANPGKVYTFAEQAETLTAPEASGEQCKLYILRLKTALEELGIPFELHSYFDNPTFFLSSATKFTRMDRINEAIDQVEDVQRLLPKLQNQLSD